VVFRVLNSTHALQRRRAEHCQIGTNRGSWRVQASAAACPGCDWLIDNNCESRHLTKEERPGLPQCRPTWQAPPGRRHLRRTPAVMLRNSSHLSSEGKGAWRVRARAISPPHLSPAVDGLIFGFPVGQGICSVVERCRSVWPIPLPMHLTARVMVNRPPTGETRMGASTWSLAGSA
jgi:hypothetical protein